MGRDIKVGLYDDMLNIVSPGGLPNGLTAADLEQGRSEIRNRVLARVFKELGYIEQWGSGIERIKTLCLAHENLEPKLRESGDFVDWEFYRPTFSQNVIAEPAPISYGVSEETTSLSEESRGLSEEAADVSEEVDSVSEKIPEKILRLINGNAHVTAIMLAEYLQVSARTIERYLKILQEQQKIKRIGSTKGGHWEVLK